MKENRSEHKTNVPAQGKSVETTDNKIEEVHLSIEELEEVIAPRIALNHNETMVNDHS